MPAIRLFCCLFCTQTGGLPTSFRHQKFQRNQRKFRTRVNRMIRVPEIRVIDEDGEQLGVMVTSDAMALAEEKGLDLVEVSPNAKPPVCRIMDYGKYKYEQNKRLKQSKKKQHTFQVKEIKLRPKTEEHDFQFKKRHAEEFLRKHNKVKFTVIFRGRELDHKEMGRRLLDRMVKDLASLGTVEREPQFEGRLMVMVMAPITTKPHQPKEPAPPREETRQETMQESKEAPKAASGVDPAEEKDEQPEAKGQDAETQNQ